MDKKEIQEIELLENERLEDLDNGLYIIQDMKKFRFGIDAVLLADFAARYIKRKSRICEIGTGTGIIPLLLSDRVRFDRLDAFEIQDEIASMAKRSVALNHLEDKIKIHDQDFKKQTLFPRNSLDLIICNPPYTALSSTGNYSGRELINPNEYLAIARHEIKMTIEDLFEFAFVYLKQGGKLVIIHRPHRFGELIIKAHDHRLSAKTARFIYPRVNKAATMVLIEFTKDGKDYLNIEPPLIVYEEDDRYTKEINEIYRTEKPSRKILKET